MRCAKQSRRPVWLAAGDGEPRITNDRGAHIQRSVIYPSPLLHQRDKLVVPKLGLVVISLCVCDLSQHEQHILEVMDVSRFTDERETLLIERQSALGISGLRPDDVTQEKERPRRGMLVTNMACKRECLMGQPIRFPLGDNQFTAVVGEIAPGGQAGRHMHPVPLLVYVLEGALSIEMEGHGTHNVTAGEAFTEVINTWHNGRNLGSTPAKFLIVFAGQDGTPITIRP